MNYKSLFEKLEKMREIEGTPNSAGTYHRLLDSLPKLLSAENLIDYHNFLMGGEHVKGEVGELTEKNEELEKANNALEKRVDKWEELNHELTEASEGLADPNDIKDQYKRQLLAKLQGRCSPEAYLVLESITQRL